MGNKIPLVYDLPTPALTLAEDVQAFANVVRVGPHKSIWRTRWTELRREIPPSGRKTLVDARILSGEPQHIPRTLAVEALEALSLWLEGWASPRENSVLTGATP